jgi:uncharacterized protein (UPF0261 family)
VSLEVTELAQYMHPLATFGSVVPVATSPLLQPFLSIAAMATPRRSAGVRITERSMMISITSGSGHNRRAVLRDLIRAFLGMRLRALG